MAPYAARPAIRFSFMSGGLSVIARSVWFTALALPIVVPVPFEHSVKKPPRRKSLDKSVPFFGPLKPLHQWLLSPIGANLGKQTRKKGEKKEMASRSVVP
jgi:hypothetical protein